MRREPTIGVILVALACYGCGSGKPFDIVPVKGTVTYDDDSQIPAESFRVKFLPQVESSDGKTFPRAAMAEVDSRGEFQLATTVKYGDGIITGEHKVYLERLPTGPNGKSLVPAAYTDPQKTPLTVDTRDGRTLHLKIPRP